MSKDSVNRFLSEALKSLKMLFFGDVIYDNKCGRLRDLKTGRFLKRE